MAARTGAEYIKGLKAQECEVWLRGERVKDVTTHPGLANGVRAITSIYDLQHELRDEMTYASPTSGERGLRITSAAPMAPSIGGSSRR